MLPHPRANVFKIIGIPFDGAVTLTECHQQIQQINDLFDGNLISISASPILSGGTPDAAYLKLLVEKAQSLSSQRWLCNWTALLQAPIVNTVVISERDRNLPNPDTDHLNAAQWPLLRITRKRGLHVVERRVSKDLLHLDFPTIKSNQVMFLTFQGHVRAI